MAAFNFAVCYFRSFVFPNTPISLWGDQVGFFNDGSRMILGQLPYRDYFQIVPPGTDLVYALLIRCFGLKMWIPNLLTAGLAAITALLMTLNCIASRAWGDRDAARLSSCRRRSDTVNGGHSPLVQYDRTALSHAGLIGRDCVTARRRCGRIVRHCRLLYPNKRSSGCCLSGGPPYLDPAETHFRASTGERACFYVAQQRPYL
jgi:hypothetical protein